MSEQNDTEESIEQLEKVLRQCSRREAGLVAVLGARAAVLALRASVGAEIDRCLADLLDLEAWARGGPVPVAAKRYVELLKLRDSAEETPPELFERYYTNVDLCEAALPIMELATASVSKLGIEDVFPENHYVVNFEPFEAAGIERMRSALGLS
jgi:hypothetical protein